MPVLQKISATPAQLQAAASRIAPPTRLPRGFGRRPSAPEWARKGVAGDLPTYVPRDDIGDPLRRRGLREAKDLTPEYFSRSAPELRDRVLFRRGQVATGIRKALDEQSFGMPLRDVYPGLPELPRRLSPDTHRGVNAVMHLHEGFERRAARLPRSVQFHSHLDPSVLVREHQALAGLTGPGARTTRDIFTTLRTPSGEASQFRDAVNSITGGRGGYGEFGQRKLPKALRKRLEQRWRDQHVSFQQELRRPLLETLPARQAAEQRAWLRYHGIPM